MRVPSLLAVTMIYYFLQARNFWKLVKAMISILHFKETTVKRISPSHFVASLWTQTPCPQTIKWQEQSSSGLSDPVYCSCEWLSGARFSQPDSCRAEGKQESTNLFQKDSLRINMKIWTLVSEGMLVMLRSYSSVSSQKPQRHLILSYAQRHCV